MGRGELVPWLLKGELGGNWEVDAIGVAGGSFALKRGLLVSRCLFDCRGCIDKLNYSSGFICWKRKRFICGDRTRHSERAKCSHS